MHSGHFLSPFAMRRMGHAANSAAYGAANSAAVNGGSLFAGTEGMRGMWRPGRGE